MPEPPSETEVCQGDRGRGRTGLDPETRRWTRTTGTAAVMRRCWPEAAALRSIRPDIDSGCSSPSAGVCSRTEGRRRRISEHLHCFHCCFYCHYFLLPSSRPPRLPLLVVLQRLKNSPAAEGYHLVQRLAGEFWFLLTLDDPSRSSHTEQTLISDRFPLLSAHILAPEWLDGRRQHHSAAVSSESRRWSRSRS